jgi:hypothetical protein
MNEFETRFHNFIAALPDCKILDDGSCNTPGGVADFLLNRESVCAELKCLDKDMLEKLQEFATELIETRNVDIYGRIPFEKIIEDQPDRGKLNRRAIYKVAQRVETDFRDANKQLRNTKKVLQIDNAHGLLIFANTQNQPLDPRLAASFLSWLFNRRKPDGQPVCSSIDAVLYLTQIHDVGDLDGVRLQPAITLFRDERPDYEPLKDYLMALLEDWAAFNRIPIFMAEQSFGQIEDFSMTPMRRAGLLKNLKQKPSPPYIAWSFPMPALCQNCGTKFAHPAGNANPMYKNEPQKDFLVIGFVCPRCDDIAATRVADLAVDRDGDTISVYPWSGSLDDMLKPEWRRFIDRSNPPNIGLPK